MDRDLRILLIVEDEPTISQRQLSKRLGCSLGTVNKLISNMVENKEVEVSHSGINDYVYKITEKGRKKKAKLLYCFVLESFDVISSMKKKIKALVEDLVKKGVSVFFLYGEKNDIYKIIKMTIIELKRDYDIDYSFVNNLDKVENDDKHFLLTWDKEEAINNINQVNILML